MGYRYSDILIRQLETHKLWVQLVTNYYYYLLTSTTTFGLGETGRVLIDVTCAVTIDNKINKYCITQAACRLMKLFWRLVVMLACHCVQNVQVSWAPGIGIKKSPFKNLFSEDLGVTYIPWDKMPISLEAVTEGGSIDEDSLPQPTPVTGD